MVPSYEEHRFITTTIVIVNIIITFDWLRKNNLCFKITKIDIIWYKVLNIFHLISRSRPVQNKWRQAATRFDIHFIYKKANFEVFADIVAKDKILRPWFPGLQSFHSYFWHMTCRHCPNYNHQSNYIMVTVTSEISVEGLCLYYCVVPFRELFWYNMSPSKLEVHEDLKKCFHWSFSRHR